MAGLREKRKIKRQGLFGRVRKKKWGWPEKKSKPSRGWRLILPEREEAV